MKPASGHTHSSPARHQKAGSGVLAPDLARIYKSVEPLSAPAPPGDFHCLLDQHRAFDSALVAKDGAAHAALPAIVEELPPDKEGTGAGAQERELLAGANKEPSLPSIAVVSAGVVPLVERHTKGITICGVPPVLGSRRKVAWWAKSELKLSQGLKEIHLLGLAGSSKRHLKIASRDSY
jgi:hypothetical protein